MKPPLPLSDEALGQGRFQYRAAPYWGRLDEKQYPVNDCHGIAEDTQGRIVLLTNDIRNNLIAYGKDGRLLGAWEHGFPGAHGLEITIAGRESHYWITDHDRQVVSQCTADGHELKRLDCEGLVPRLKNAAYQPTSVAIMPDGDFFVSDGYGSNLIHHFDPQWRYVASFGGVGKGPENLNCPHAVWVDPRRGAPQLLVCDRGNNTLKWFSPRYELLRIVELPSLGFERIGGLLPANVVRFQGELQDHIAVACLSGTVLVLDADDRVVSVVGGASAEYVDGKLQPLRPYNHLFSHPHDVCTDISGALYVAQWWASHTYPIKLERLVAVSPSQPATR